MSGTMPDRSQSAVVVFSGGMDSTTLLYHVLKKPNISNVIALSFDYGQRHKVELESAWAIASMLSVSHHVIDLQSITKLIQGSSQTDPSVPVPQGHYADDNMKLTVVPNRNMIMLSIAVAHAVSINASTVYFGAHSGDHTIYPDCRPGFVGMMDDVCQIANWYPVKVKAPFVGMTKTDICKLGGEMDVPFGMTWTCYDPQPNDTPRHRYRYRPAVVHCGKCGSCVERRESFRDSGVSDPTQYAI